MREAFDFTAPTRVRFGVGRSRELPQVLTGGRWGLVTTPNVLSRSGIRDSLDECRRSGIEILALGDVSPNPRLGQVERALGAARGSAIVGVVAVGGGSVMDAAKLLAVAFRFGATASAVLGDLDRVVRGGRSSECSLVVVPTTAGTGSEVSQGAIITDESSGRKLAARGRELVPDAAVIDPRLALSLSPRRTAETGFDVVTHAVETYLSLAATPVTDVFALAALEVVPAALVRAVNDPANLEARTVLALHSWLMGYNLAHASTCLPHRMQYPVGALTDTSHQIGLAALYPAWVSAVASHTPARLKAVTQRVQASLAEVAAAPAGGPDPEQVFRALLRTIGIEVTLADVGIPSARVDALTDAVEGRTDLDPMRPSRADIRRLFIQSLGA